MGFLSTKSIYSRSLIAIFMLIDTTCIFLASQLTISDFNLFQFSFRSSFTIWVLLWLVVSVFLSLYQSRQIVWFGRMSLFTISGLFIHYLVINLLSLNLIVIVSAHKSLLLYIITCTLLISVKGGIIFFLRQWRNFTGRKIPYVIVGFSKAGISLYKYLENLQFGYECLGFFDDYTANDKVVGRVNDLEVFCKKHEVQHIYYALHYQPKEIQRLITFADNYFIYFGRVCHTDWRVISNVASTKIEMPSLSTINKSNSLEHEYIPDFYHSE